MKKKKKTGLNFYSRKGTAFDALKPPDLFFPWLIVMFLTLEIARMALIVFGVSLDIRQQLHKWNSHAIFGLDMAGIYQMLGLLIAGYTLAHLGVFLTLPFRNRRSYVIGIAMHVFGIIVSVLYIFAYGDYGPWLARL